MHQSLYPTVRSKSYSPSGIQPAKLVFPWPVAGIIASPLFHRDLITIIICSLDFQLLL